MRKGFERCLRNEVKSCGNYHYENNTGDVVEVFYHTTCITAYSREKGIFFIDDRGFNTTSTHCAYSGVHAVPENWGLEEVTVEEFKAQTGAECRVGGWAY